MNFRTLLKLSIFVLCVGFINILLIIDIIIFKERHETPDEVYSVDNLPNFIVTEEVENRSYAAGKTHLFERSLLSLLPELITINQTMLEPMYLTKRNLRQRKIAFCISVVKRRVSYIEETLALLFRELEEAYRSEVVFIVMLAFPDPSHASFQSLTGSLLRTFSTEIRDGLLEVAAIPQIWYRLIPNFATPTFNDSKERMLWRTKQNIDYIFLMNYGSKRADYYMHLEDDLNVTHNYARVIFDYIELKQRRPWFSMHFTNLGFIGKMFRSEEIKYLTHAIALYYQYKPVDWILSDVEYSRYCSPEHNTTQCQKARTATRVVVGPPLFQHIGKFSSLTGKVQKLKEKFFEKHNFKASRGNPRAMLFTSMATYLKHSAQAGYDTYGFMWFTRVKSGDYLKIMFTKPTKVVGVLMISGIAPAPEDKFGEETKVYAQDASFGETHLGSFSEHGDFVAHLDGRELTSIDLRVGGTLSRWVILGHVTIDAL